ncbi:magnesium and cobalt transport protein CorA [Dyadobacter luticola]|uniref:Magnesium and cobalt transport protein CorA n=1 Tax=Dyadobacter luticola TaxID=1979387 RepID=A0A5R9KRN9_9BACT|nr:magnesium and cobalt transport protein CorA [Dyadobacter luticola]TLU98951.1 magnesium and cobalt transport protein CorA [Dyadobacter luticola]
MFEKNDKRRLYWLIDQYLLGQMTERDFCDEFYYSYSLEISDNDLTELEKRNFSELDKIASRYSEFEEDHKSYPKAFYTATQLKEKIQETKEKLNICI